MSGPKLSAYELEQLRKAELERIHREIIRIKTLAMAEIQRVQSEIQRCQEELSRLNYQRKLVEASSLSAADKDSVNHEIQFQMDQVLSLEREYSAIHPEPFGTTLEEVQRVYSLLSEQIADCTHSRQAIESSRGTYEALLSKVAENLCEQVSTESYSLDEALANLPPRVITGEALQDQKNALVQRVYAITNNPLANPDTKARVQKALRRINETNNQRELEEIGSMVVGEIERNLKQIEPLMGEYLQLMCRKNALATSLGLPEENPMQGINNVAELRQLIHSTKMQVEKMQAQHLELAEREEIARSIDAAMEELGYEFIGVKQSENSTSRIKLFEFSEGTGLQITHRQDGVVRIKVVGLAGENRQPTDREQDLLFREQNNFCDEYEEIIEAFRRKGVLMRAGTQKRNPPSRQFSQIVNVTDYNANYTAPGLSSEARAKRAEKRTARKPKVLSKQ